MKKCLRSIICFLLITCSLSAQEANDFTNRIQDLVRYLNLDQKSTGDDINMLAEALRVAEDPTQERNTRSEEWLKIENYFFDIMQDPDSSFKKRSLHKYGFPLFAAFLNHKLPDSNQSEFTPNNSPGRVEKRGSGSEHLIIIPPLGMGTSIYEDFIQQYQHLYTFHTITLPGFDGVSPYAREVRRDLSKMTWFQNIENGILGLMERENIGKAFLMGDDMGGFIATRFGINHPDKTKGIIAINSPVNTPMAAADNPKSPASLEERTQRMKTLFPHGEFFPFPVFQPTATYQSPLSAQPEPIRDILKHSVEGLNTYAHRIYQDQFRATDLMYRLGELKVPLLSIVSVHDALSPFIIQTRKKVVAWQKVLQKFPQKPIHYVPFHQSRDLILFDQPQKAGNLIQQFTLDPEGFQFKSTDAINAVNKSPGAVISQTIGNTDLSVTYSRPSTRGREIFGKLIPYGKVWRAGANEATEISFSRNVWIYDHLLESGTYSLFIEPYEDKWTIVLNSITDQWGTFDYDPAYDVLRFDVIPKEANHQEWLKYDFENLKDNSVDLTLQWDKYQIRIPLREFFEVPSTPDSFKSFVWIELLQDTVGDIRNKSSSDGKTFSYYHDTKTDSLWFKFETYNDISIFDPAISVSIDTDNNQETGAPWYGSNRAFKVDLMLSAGPVRQGNGYDGWNGITDAEGIRTRNWINIIQGNLTFYFDQANKAYFLGVKRSDLGKDVVKINLIGSVGANSTWNDDIGKDGTYATITLKK